MRNGLLGGSTAPFLDSGRGLSFHDVDNLQRPTENDEETQREECSSTESTHQEVIKTAKVRVSYRRYRIQCYLGRFQENCF